jgi:hypothetical protein
VILALVKTKLEKVVTTFISTSPLHEVHVFNYLKPILANEDRVIVVDQFVDGFDVSWSHFLQHHIKLNSLVASSDDQHEQDVHHEDEASKVATRQS